MTPAIRHLAILLAHDIRYHQNANTRYNRRQALTLIEDQLVSQTASDEDLIKAVLAAQAHILSNRSFFNFGIGGLSSSYFLRATEDFLNIATHLLVNLPQTDEPKISNRLIRMLGKQIVDDIDLLPNQNDGDQNIHTLLDFAWQVKNPECPDRSILDSAIRHRDYVLQNRFAFWQHNWHLFAKMSQFITQAKSLLRLQQPRIILPGEPANKTVTRILAEQIITEIQAAPKNSQGNPNTLTAFAAKVANSECSDADIIKSAITHYHSIPRNRFAFWRHDWHLVEKMDHFLSQAMYFDKLNKPKEPEEPKPEPVVEIKKETKISERAKILKEFESKNHVYVLMEKVRDLIGDVIYSTLKKLFRSDKTTSGWHYHIQKVISGEKDVDDGNIFFEIHKEKFENNETLSTYASAYKSIINVPQYLEFLREWRFKAENSPPPQRKQESVQEKSKKSVNEEPSHKEKMLQLVRDKISKEEPKSDLLQQQLKEFADKNPNYVKMEKQRESIEKVIFYFLEHNQNTNPTVQRAMIAWNRRHNKIAARETNVDDMIFFTNFKEILKPIEDFVDEYLKKFSSDEYRDYLKQLEAIFNAPHPQNPPSKANAIVVESKVSKLARELRKFNSTQQVSAHQKFSIHRDNKEAEFRGQALRNFDTLHPQQVKQNQQREALEATISAILENKNNPFAKTRLPHTWQMLRSKFISESNFDFTFFDSKANQEEFAKCPELCNKIEEYKAIINDANFLVYFRGKAQLQNASEQEIKKQFPACVDEEVIKPVIPEYAALGIYMTR